jgi:hypothetical protein
MQPTAAICRWSRDIRGMDLEAFPQVNPRKTRRRAARAAGPASAPGSALGPPGARRATAAQGTRSKTAHMPRCPLPGSRVPCQCRSPPARRVRQRRVLARHWLPGILADDRNIGNDTGPASPALLAFVYPHRDVDGFQGLAHHTGQVRADRL